MATDKFFNEVLDNTSSVLSHLAPIADSQYLSPPSWRDIVSIRLQALYAILLLLFAAPCLCAPKPKYGLFFLKTKDYQAVPVAELPSGTDEIPRATDLSNRFPRPGNQGKQGSCVGWAAAYALKTYQESVELDSSPTITERIFSPSYIYNQIKLSNNCKAGAYLTDALTFLQREGAISIRAFPYDERSCNRKPTEEMRRAARAYSIDDWRRVPAIDARTFKGFIAAGFPILVSIHTDKAFKRLRRGQVYRDHSTRYKDKFAHAVVVVGYSDDAQALKIINSWGSDWADDGFGWLAYDTIPKLVREAYISFDSKNPQPKPAPELKRSKPLPKPRPKIPEPKISIGAAHYHHNVNVAVGGLSYPGMEIVLDGSARDAAGRNVQLVAAFNFSDGSPVWANPNDMYYRAGDGHVVVRSHQHPVKNEFFDLAEEKLYIPYYAFNLRFSNYYYHYQLSFTVEVYLDGKHVGNAAPVAFSIRW